MTKDEFINIQKEIAITLSPYGVTTGSITFKKTKRIMGTCAKKDNFFTFRYSEYLLEGNMELIKFTITHELCHTVEGCFSHGKKFKETFKKFAEIIGVNLKAWDIYLLRFPKTAYFRCNGCGSILMCDEVKKEVYIDVKGIESVFCCSKCGQSDFTELGI